MTEPKRILVVEDDPDLRRGLRKVFETEGFAVEEAADGPAGLAAALAGRPQLVILDIAIPGLDGFGVCRELRSRGAAMPVLILTARAGDVDKVLGFELGADDYVVKPFSVVELVARVKALLRRLAPAAGERCRFGDVEVDFRTYKIQRPGKTAELYHYEAEILKALVQREGQIVHRNELLDAVWGKDSYPTARTVDFHVCNLRKKVEADPSRPRHIVTVHGVGYRFVR